MSMSELVLLKARLFNKPHCIHEEKLKVIADAVGPRLLGLEPTPLPNGDPLTPRLYDTYEGIAVVPVLGTLVNRTSGLNTFSGLTSYSDIRRALDTALEDEAVAGVLLDIDSPGGEVSGLFDLVDYIHNARTQKPLWAVANDEAYSAAYAIASAAEQIWVTRTSGVGSIGVVAVHLDESRANEKEGLHYTVFRGGAYKAEHNSLEPLTDHAHDSLQQEVDRLYALFTETVGRNRRLDVAHVQGTEAITYHGPAALHIGLATHLGTFDDAFNTLLDSLTRPSGGYGAYTPSPSSIHTQSDEDSIMDKDDKVVDLDAARADALAEGRAAALSDTNQILTLCQLAGRTDLAQGFIKQQKSPADVQAALLELAAKTTEAQAVDPVVDAPKTEPPARINARDVYRRRNAENMKRS